MPQKWRFSVRLDPVRAALLQKLSTETGCGPSEVVRVALDRFEASRAPGQSSGSSTPGKGSGDVAAASVAVARLTGPMLSASAPAVRLVPLSNPPKLAELLAFYRSCGGKVWEERRQLFHRLFSAAGAAQEHRENPRDVDLYNELLRLGRTYGLFN